jgi:hypothetical protein
MKERWESNAMFATGVPSPEMQGVLFAPHAQPIHSKTQYAPQPNAAPAGRSTR